MTTVLVVDDHPLLRDGVRAALAGSGISIVAEAGSGADAVREAALHGPDVVLMDLALPDMSGIEAMRAILRYRADTAVLAFTMSEDDDSVLAAVRAGAVGYIVKGVSRDELVRAVEAVAGGEALFLGPGVARRVRDRLNGEVPRTVGADVVGSQDGAPRLTVRERQVLDLMAAGWGNATIATRLHLAPKTVRNVVSGIIGKLQAADRGEAIVRARRLGFGADAG